MSILFILVVGLVEVALEHKWRDRRTRTHKRVRGLLIGLMFCSAAVAISLVIFDAWEAEKVSAQLSEIRASSALEAQNAARREGDAVAREERLESELSQLRIALEPFQRLASARYPSEPPDSALSKLASDVSALQQRAARLEEATESIATQDVFRPLSPTLRSQVLEYLSHFRSGVGSQLSKITVSCDTGTRGRQLVANELVDLLKSANFQTEGPISEMSFSSDPLPPVSITIHPQDVAMALSLAKALRPLMRVEFAATRSDTIQRGQVELQIHGSPVFGGDGSVDFR